MSAVVWLPLLTPEEAPEGLWESLAASCRLLGRFYRVEFLGGLWRRREGYLARVIVDGQAELWTWEPGEPLFVRDGGI